MIIRQVTDEDLAQCYMVETISFPPHLAASKDSIKRRIDWFPRGFLVAEVEGAVIGMINSGATSHEDVTDEKFLKQFIGHEPKGKNLFILSVAVVPKYQGKGVARYLLNAMHERALEMEMEQMLLHCQADLVKYYEQLGYVNNGPTPLETGSENWYLMAKQVDRAEVEANMVR